MNNNIQTINLKNKDIQTLYSCDKCKQDTSIINKEQIVCKYCGNRILYKKRTYLPIEHLCR